MAGATPWHPSRNTGGNKRCAIPVAISIKAFAESQSVLTKLNAYWGAFQVGGEYTTIPETIMTP
jgi:hypothetical protein